MDERSIVRCRGWLGTRSISVFFDGRPCINLSGVQCSSCDAHLDHDDARGDVSRRIGDGLHQVLELNVESSRTRTSSVIPTERISRRVEGMSIPFFPSDTDSVTAKRSHEHRFHLGSGNRASRKEEPCNDVSNTNNMPSLRLALRMGFGSRTSASDTTGPQRVSFMRRPYGDLF